LLIHITCWLHFNVLSFQMFLGQGACVRGLLLFFEADLTFLQKDQKVVLTPCGRGGGGRGAADKVLNMKGSDEVFQQICYKSRSSSHLYTL